MVYIQGNFYTFLEMRVKMGWVDTASEVSILLLETNSERLQRKEKSLTL